MTPTLTDGVFEYAAETFNATDLINVTTAKTGATVAIKVNDITHTNNTVATWVDGANTVSIVVTYGNTTNTYNIAVTNSEATVQLSALTLGSLVLDPTFAAGTYNYTTSTTNATNVVTATAVAGATATITVNEEAHTSGEAATWDEGENTVEITVTKSEESKVYTVIVTKGE